MRGNRTREKLLAGKHVHVLGGHNHSAATIDFIGPLGFDGFWIEGEHAGVSFNDIGNVSRACDLWGISSVMRVHDNNAGLIGRTLDCGVNGIVVPHVSTREDAENVVKATRFAPVGMRGMYSGRRGYGVENYVQKANDEILTVVLIEEMKAVNNLDEILSINGIDVFFVAPGDLAQTMGYVGDWFRPEVQDVVSSTLKRIVDAGRIAGTLNNKDTLQEHIDIGVQFLHMYYDAWIREGAAGYFEEIEGMIR